MPSLIIDGSTAERHHLACLSKLLEDTEGPIRIASAFVTERDLLTAAVGRERRLLIPLRPIDVASGAMSLATLEVLIESGVQCRWLAGDQFLHAKVYVFGTSHVVITSANLTYSALNSNIEAGVLVDGPDTQQVVDWFDSLWVIASPVTIAELVELKTHVDSLRAAYKALASAAKKACDVVPKTDVRAGALGELFAHGQRFFVCNTNRTYSARTPVGGFVDEEMMHTQQHAVVWEEFRYPDHMKKVTAGDAVMMYANGVGIVGIGVAKGGVEIAHPGDPTRLGSSNTQAQSEWRVPVRWLAWLDEASACPVSPRRPSFFDISGSEYEAYRDQVKTHFLDAIDTA
jgi:hypothetical protein